MLEVQERKYGMKRIRAICCPPQTFHFHAPRKLLKLTGNPYWNSQFLHFK
jgi:hypothetical protein